MSASASLVSIAGCRCMVQMGSQSFLRGVRGASVAPGIVRLCILRMFLLRSALATRRRRGALFLRLNVSGSLLDQQLKPFVSWHTRTSTEQSTSDPASTLPTYSADARTAPHRQVQAKGYLLRQMRSLKATETLDLNLLVWGRRAGLISTRDKTRLYMAIGTMLTWTNRTDRKDREVQESCSSFLSRCRKS